MGAIAAVASLAGILCLFGIPAWAAQTQAATTGGKVFAVTLAVLAVLAWLAVMVLNP